MLNFFEKKKELESKAANSAPAPPEAGDLDRTDPLSTSGPPAESANLLLETPAGRLEHVTLAGKPEAAGAFIRLSLRDAALAEQVRGALMSQPETASGFRDLLIREDTSLCAAFDAPQATLANWTLGLHPDLHLRPLQLLEGFAAIARMLHKLHATGGLIWPAPAAQWIGLHHLPSPWRIAGLAQYQLWFMAWPELAAGSAPAGAAALAELALQAWRGYIAHCDAAGFLAPLPALRAWELKLSALLQTPELDYARLADQLDPGPLNLLLHGATDVGQRREHNEDAYLLYQVEQHSSSGARFYLAAVADGMGGHASGEIASSLALDLLRTQLPQLLIPPKASLCDPAQLPAALAQLIPAIDSALIERARLEPSLGGMGTTLCGLAALAASSTLVAQDSPLPAHCAVFWVGDSRAYLLGPGGLQPLSSDHSYVCDLVAAGEITAAEAFDHPMKNIITRCLGGNGGESRPDVREFTPGPGEVVLLCSDGLSDALRDGEIWEALCAARTASAAELAVALIAAANDAGGPDNITVVLASCC